jgi:ELWxxDGT repeat protein
MLVKRIFSFIFLVCSSLAANAQINLVKDIAPGTDGSFPREIAIVNNKLYFTADDQVHCREMWSHDPVTNTTQLEHDIITGSGNGIGTSGLFTELCELNGKIYFTGNSSVNGAELWMYDGVNHRLW